MTKRKGIDPNELLRDVYDAQSTEDRSRVGQWVRDNPDEAERFHEFLSAWRTLQQEGKYISSNTLLRTIRDSFENFPALGKDAWIHWVDRNAPK